MPGALCDRLGLDASRFFGEGNETGNRRVVFEAQVDCVE
jgi:hypothetical protein